MLLKLKVINAVNHNSSDWESALIIILHGTDSEGMHAHGLTIGDAYAHTYSIIWPLYMYVATL